MSLLIRITALLLVIVLARKADLLDRNSNDETISQKIFDIDVNDHESHLSSPSGMDSEVEWKGTPIMHPSNLSDAVVIASSTSRDASRYRRILDVEPLAYFRYGNNFNNSFFVTGVDFDSGNLGDHGITVWEFK